MLHDRGPRMLADREAPVLSAIDIFVKDSSLVAVAAEARQAQVPLLNAAAAKFAEVSAAGRGRADDSSVIQAYRPLDHGLHPEHQHRDPASSPAH